MSCGNLHKHMLQNAVNSLLDIFTTIKSNPRAVNDDQMECMQFGICSFVSKPLKKFLIFITNQEKNMKIQTSFTVLPKYFNDFHNYFNNADEKLVSYTYIPVSYTHLTLPTILLV